MKRILLAMAVFMGAAMQAVPAAADVSYTLNCSPGGSSFTCPSGANYGSVTLHQLGTGVSGSSTNIVEVTVNLIPVMENFAGTGAGFAVNWNISGNPSLDTTIKPLDYNNDPLPTGAISRTYGRRVAFIIGTFCGVLTGALGAFAILHSSFWLFCCATFLGGLYGAVSQSYRFAAADGASAAFRPKAVSWVMAGGVFAGVLGPQLVQWTMDIWPPYLFAFSFVMQALVALVAMAVLSGVDAPKPAPSDLHGGRPLFEIARQPRFIAAALCGVIAYPMMNLVMTSAPLAMKMCGLSVSDSNFGIQWHIVAMYGPSFFTGSLIGRFGAPRIVALGLMLEATGAAIGLSGITAMHFWATLIVLGVGWNFAFIGASALVLETHRPQERNKVQAFNDFLVFGMMAVGSFSSGQLLAHYGWSAVNMVVFPPVLLGLAILSFASFAKRRRRLQAVDEIPDLSI